MDNLIETEARLWDYIDGTANSEEASVIKRLIAENAEWRAKYHELLEMHSLIATTELDEPSMRFTKNVMEEIARLHIAPAAKNYINNKVIWGIGIFFVTLIIGFLGYGFSQIDWSAANPNNNLIDKVTSVDYGIMFNDNFVNGFMMLNVLLGLMLLDRYLSNKRKQFQQEA
ncbi:MAG: hypothetical protein C4329_07820 [Chitinophagaceae bacterium]